MADLSKKRKVSSYPEKSASSSSQMLSYDPNAAVGNRMGRVNIEQAVKSFAGAAYAPEGTQAEIEAGTEAGRRVYSPQTLNLSINSLIDEAVPTGTEAQIIAGDDSLERKFSPQAVNSAIKTVGVAQYDSIAEIEAITGQTSGQSVYLSAGGRSGPFEWLVGDFTAEVAADPLQGVYIESSSIPASSGVWKRPTGVGPLSFGYFFEDYAAVTPADSALLSASNIAINLGVSLHVPHETLRISAYPNLGDLKVVADDCQIVGGYPRAKELRGFRQSGVRDAEYANMPPRSKASATAKIVYAESASKVWVVTPNATRAGGKAIRLRSVGAPGLSGPNDAGGDFERIRQDLIYDVTFAFTCTATPLATSGAWSDSAMVSSGWPQVGAGTNLLEAQNLQRNTSAGGSYIEYSVAPNDDGQFNVGLYVFSGASDSVQIYDQSNGVLIDTLDLSSGAGDSAYVVRKFTAPKMGPFTLRIINNGSATTDLRVIGVNVFRPFSGDKINSNDSPDTFNFIRTSSAWFNSGSASTPVYTVRQGGSGGSGITAGSIHGGEVRDSVSWIADGEPVSTDASPAIGTIWMGYSVGLTQNTTLTWPDGQTATYHEELFFSGNGTVDCTSVLESDAGLRIQNSYNGMAPLPTKFDTITFPQTVDLGVPAASDQLFYPAVTGENMISLESSSDGDRVDFHYTTYPNSQTRNFPGAVQVNMASISDGYCKIYCPQYLGADRDVSVISSRSVLVMS